MPAPFKQITREQFADLLFKFPFKRKINAVHMHHTWRPNRSQYRGHDTIVAMWRFHTQENHWSDIAQHITIAPDGSIWLGRDWNRPPASAKGHNGNEDAGPFMFEMIGDFDEGMDTFDGEQRKTALEVIARVQLRFGLPPGSLQLHNMMSTKSCPGTSIDYQTVLREVAELHPQLLSSARQVPPADAPFGPDQLASGQIVREAIQSLQRERGSAIDPPDAEPWFHGREYREIYADNMSESARDSGLDVSAMQALRPHVVNLRMGRFSSSGNWTTTPSDVDAIFEDYLPKALSEAKAAGRPLRLMFYAHGGLTSEEDALARTRELVPWWAENHIYPIHFIWETGLCETLGQMLQGAQQGREYVTRNFFSDNVTDPLIEAFAHRAGGVDIWGAMKWSAQQASAENALGGAANAKNAEPGGARYVAEKLAAFCKTHGDDVEVHACGHSAGSIFHSHFIPCALELGVPKFNSLHFMAPAVRVDLFHQQLGQRIGKSKGVDKLAMYTMADAFERNDNCGQVYRKSLLYLIYKGLEPELDVPILGLERCVRGDAGLKRLFGIGGAKTDADVIWSDNGLSQGRSASQSHTHGGFHHDPATMGSIVRRVLGKEDADPIIELPMSRLVSDPWSVQADMWATILAEHGIESFAMAPQPQQPVAPVPSWSAGLAGPAPLRPQPGVATSGAGRRTALCVGIDTYPSAPLGGCVNDARAWSDTLMRLGFDTPITLLNQQATRLAIVQQLTSLVNTSRAGDVIVFQYAGHGTQVPDLDGDELDGDTPGEDEAICPYDFASGELLVDDDIRAIFQSLPDGVNLTCFFDCCHSGTITRFAIGTNPGGYGPQKRARFIAADATLIANYVAKRAGARALTVADPSIESMREVVFSACLSSEVALESDGHGDFTRKALQVLAAGAAGLSNGEFADRVTQAFGSAPQQHAKLYSSSASRQLELLQPLRVPTRGRPSGGRALSPRERAGLAVRLMRARSGRQPA